jgi:hypothetical protein
MHVAHVPTIPCLQHASPGLGFRVHHVLSIMSRLLQRRIALSANFPLTPTPNSFHDGAAIPVPPQDRTLFTVPQVSIITSKWALVLSNVCGTTDRTIALARASNCMAILVRTHFIIQCQRCCTRFGQRRPRDRSSVTLTPLSQAHEEHPVSRPLLRFARIRGFLNTVAAILHSMPCHPMHQLLLSSHAIPCMQCCCNASQSSITGAPSSHRAPLG